MKYVKVQSDYAPDTYMQLVHNDEGDFVFKIRGNGEMRIAVSGGQFHGKRLGAICEAAKALIAALSGETLDSVIKTYGDRIREKNDEELAELLFRVSHDMRKPLNKEQILRRLREPCGECTYEKDC